MSNVRFAILAISALALPIFAGCMGPARPDAGTDTQGAIALPSSHVDIASIVEASLRNASGAMAFVERRVTAAVSYGADLYEPTMEVSAAGTIYITGHTVLVDTTGAPVYMSKDDGKTWSQLPFLGPATMPGALPGATPPPSDEIFLVAGDNGWLWGVDITLATFPVNGWSGNGSQHAYHNPNAYDEHQAVLQASDCVPAPIKDRPWAAYSNGTLLMVSNPAAGPAQVGVLDVPVVLPNRQPIPAGVGAAAAGGWWNLCAGPGAMSTDCSIPGVPDIRADGQFAVPQRCRGVLYLITGNKLNIMDTQVRKVFPHSSGGEITSVYGHAAFDANGTLFVGITNNTAPDKERKRVGGLHLAASQDGGKTFVDRTFTTARGQHLRHLYMDANKFGPGALAVWAVDGDKRDANGNAQSFDWYAGHVQLGADGAPVLANAYLIIDEGPAPSAHVTGASLGPDGRAYTAMFKSTAPGGTPLSVYVQESGPTIPVRTPLLK